MNPDDPKKALVDLQQRITDLDERLRPIANRAVDICDPQWLLKLRQSPHPLDEAGIRNKVEGLLTEVLEVYSEGDQECRQAVRGMLSTCSSFAWAAVLPFRPTSTEYFRKHLLHFSVLDQGKDTRDAILALQDICSTAKTAGVEIAPVLREVADLSSDIDKYGMGSTRKLLLSAC